MQNGFITVASAVPLIKVSNCNYNIQQIESLIAQAEGKGVEIISFPELCITGCTCNDLLTQSLLMEKVEESILKLLDFTRQLDIISIVGMPLLSGNTLINCAAVIQKGDILGIVPKCFLSNSREHNEKRWFKSAKHLPSHTIRFAGKTIQIDNIPKLFRTYTDVLFGVELSEDVLSPNSPGTDLLLSGADIIFNLSGINATLGRYSFIKRQIQALCRQTSGAYVYTSAGFGESTQDVVFSGDTYICENGDTIGEGDRFTDTPQLVISQVDVMRLRCERRRNNIITDSTPQESAAIINAHSIELRDFELRRAIEPHPFIPNETEMRDSCNEIFSIQTSALAKRITHISAKRVIIGISGGLDSTLALLVCAKTFDKLKMPRKDIIGVTMPGFGTTDRTYTNALDLMSNLGITTYEISIKNAVMQHFSDIGHDADIHDVTYENSQARERTQILMDMGNKLGALVIGTGDLSELVLGWATYNGDHMSMYGVNAGVPKTLIQYLVRYVAQYEMDENTGKILCDIIDTPISPELIPANSDGEITQKTEDLVGPYELHDFFIYHMLTHGYRPSRIYMLACNAFRKTYDNEEILKWLKIFLRRFFSQQFKRSCLPDGPKVLPVGLSPRGDLMMPSDADATIWLEECDMLQAHNI